MAFEHDLCIRGAGIVGRTLALLAARDRLRVALVAPPAGPPATADVRAYAISPAVQALLQSLRCWPEGVAATPVLAMQVQADQQGAVHFSAQQQGVAALNWIVDVPRLEQLLAEAVRYQSAIDVIDAPVAAPLTVVCEGRASATRAELGIEYDSVRYPQHALATRLDCERPHEQVARQWFTSEGDVLAFLPLGGPGGREVAVVWSLASERAALVAAWDDATLAAHLHDMSGDALGALQVQGARASWPLVLAHARRWVGAMPGRVGESFALAGDAAHAMHPLAGQGLNVGLGDAAELARVLAARERWRPVSDLRLLRRYERARQGHWLRMRWATDGLQLLFGHPGPLAGPLRNWGMTLFDHSGPLKARVARLAMNV
ncbi:MAG: FAD-dependent monooxygenase [Burkholderiales bacterium]|uniref:FAD-dependent monooxygenase n=1 Tax=Ottowia sp. TaxID=1898956 RepID=UPI001ACA3181|nr:FAD-dependent monooxygenase [Ottowia sp.]MBN9405858.1 FAD-dependent monooxygenase [Burkholderiales bacterium]MBS0404025.1 FAD-dependent monooxygenase [Pseudomonadota bacterium]MBS0413595.1 FAD-dependent monooxygenase [Pseudomonadota bacterium]